MGMVEQEDGGSLGPMMMPGVPTSIRYRKEK